MDLREQVDVKAALIEKDIDFMATSVQQAFHLELIKLPTQVRTHVYLPTYPHTTCVHVPKHSVYTFAGCIAAATQLFLVSTTRR